MRENILNMPHHLRRQRVVTAEQAAMAMAGVYRFACLREFDKVMTPKDTTWLVAIFVSFKRLLTKS